MSKNSSNTPTGNNAILNAFKSKFATTVNIIHVNSLNADLKFREVSVTEQKSLSKIMIENENRRDIVYDAQCALINKLCLDKVEENIKNPETGEITTKLRPFDIYKLTEFDRIRIMMEIYQNNYFHNNVEYICPVCSQKNSYTLDFANIIARLNEFDLKDITYYVEDKNYKYNFILNYPQVQAVSEFYKQYMQKYRGTNKKQQEVLDNLGNIDYINLFIKRIELINKNDPKDTQIADLTLMSYSDIEELISYFPQNIVFSDDVGVLKYIAKEFIEKINKAFSYEKCQFCGAETREGIGSTSDFFL